MMFRTNTTNSPQLPRGVVLLLAVVTTAFVVTTVHGFSSIVAPASPPGSFSGGGGGVGNDHHPRSTITTSSSSSTSSSAAVAVAVSSASSTTALSTMEPFNTPISRRKVAPPSTTTAAAAAAAAARTAIDSVVVDQLDIQSDKDWLQFVTHDQQSMDDNTIIKVVWFKSPTCKACQRMAIDWKRQIIPLATTIIGAASKNKKKKKQQEDVLTTLSSTTTTSPFVKNRLQLATFDVQRRDNASIYKQLGIQALPSCHIYYKGLLLEEMIIKPKEFHKLTNTVQQYLNMSPLDLKQQMTKQDDGYEEEDDEYEYATELDL